MDRSLGTGAQIGYCKRCKRQIQEEENILQDEAIAMLLAVRFVHLYHFFHDRCTRNVNFNFARKPRPTFKEIVSIFTREDFKSAYRMYPETFQNLLDLIRADVTKDPEAGRRSKRETVSPDIQLAITLRMLAGACYPDLQTSYRIGRSTVYEIFHSTCSALMNGLHLSGLPNNVEELRSSALRFKTSRRKKVSPLNGWVGALDGISVKIKKPRRTERPASYYCRKGYYALPVQALVDSTYRFLCFSAICVGSTHDAAAHAISRLGRFLSADCLQREFWIVGDDAYQCDEFMIPPYPTSQAGEAQRNFNYFLSVLRVHVEQAFGMLVGRWRIIKDGLQFSVSRNSRIVCLCMKLHNFCIDNGDEDFSHDYSGIDREQIEADFDLWYGECKEVDREHREAVQNNRQGSGTVSVKRHLLCEYLRASGMKRPEIFGVPYE